MGVLVYFLTAHVWSWYWGQGINGYLIYLFWIVLTNKQTKQNITRLTGPLMLNTNAFTRPGKWWWKQQHKRYKQMAEEKWLKSQKMAQWLRCACKGLEFIPSSHIRWLQLSVPPATGESMPPSGLWGNVHPCELLKLKFGNPVIVIHCEACHSSGKAKTNLKM